MLRLRFVLGLLGLAGGLIPAVVSCSSEGETFSCTPLKCRKNDACPSFPEAVKACRDGSSFSTTPCDGFNVVTDNGFDSEFISYFAHDTGELVASIGAAGAPPILCEGPPTFVQPICDQSTFTACPAPSH